VRQVIWYAPSGSGFSIGAAIVSESPVGTTFPSATALLSAAASLMSDSASSGRAEKVSRISVGAVRSTASRAGELDLSCRWNGIAAGSPMAPARPRMTDGVSGAGTCASCRACWYGLNVRYAVRKPQYGPLVGPGSGAYYQKTTDALRRPGM